MLISPTKECETRGIAGLAYGMTPVPNDHENLTENM
jgi:hypothetical protein